MDADLKLVGTLFENLPEPEWANEFLKGVCEATRSPAGAVLQVDVASRKQTLPAYVGQAREMAVAFERKHAESNPWRPADESRGPPPGSVVVPDDVLPLSTLRRTAFWADFLRPMQVDHGCGVIGFRSTDKVVSITLLRSARDGLYSTEERSWLGRLAPHWVNACNLRDRLAPAKRNGWDAARVFDMMGTAAFLLDDHGKCAHWNAAADEQLRDGSLVRLRGGRLVAASPSQGAIVPDGAGPTVLRRKDGSVGGHAAAHRLPGNGALGVAPAVVFVDPMQAAAPERLKHTLAILYGLTPRESELALRLADGADLAEAAEAMGLTPGATRTRLKTVYWKSGVGHQAGLVALVRSVRTVIGRGCL